MILKTDIGINLTKLIEPDLVRAHVGIKVGVVRLLVFRGTNFKLEGLPVLWVEGIEDKL